MHAAILCVAAILCAARVRQCRRVLGRHRAAPAQPQRHAAPLAAGRTQSTPAPALATIAPMRSLRVTAATFTIYTDAPRVSNERNLVGNIAGDIRFLHKHSN